MESLDSPRSVNDLIRNPPPKFDAQKMQAVATRRLTRLGVLQPGISGAASVPVQPRRLQLQLQRVVCIDETNGLFGSERGNDEIELGGVALDGTTNIGKVGPFGLGDFNDGTRRDFPRKPMFDFQVGGTFPRAFYATLIMVEADNGNFNDTVNAIIDKLAKESIEALTAAIGGAIGGALGPAGFLVGIIVGYVVGKVFNFLKAAWEDDPFRPKTIEVIIPSADATIAQPSRVVKFNGPGEYAVRYFLDLSAPR